MLQILPFLAWLAAVTSAVLIVALWSADELRTAHAVVLVAWFLLAAWCQFFAASALPAAVGLLLQTVLAVYLLVCWKLVA